MYWDPSAAATARCRVGDQSHVAWQEADGFTKV